MSAYSLQADQLRQVTRETGFRVKPLADQMGLGIRTLERRFEEQLLSIPSDWIRQERITASLPLLAAGLLNKEVADRLGYTNSANFGRDFKRVAGCTPREYLRRKYDETEPRRRNRARSYVAI